MRSQPKKSAPVLKVGDELKDVPVDLIQPGKYQPRNTAKLDRNALEELAASIAQHGVLQPIIIRPISTNRFEIIAGERRWRASQIAGNFDIPSIIRHYTDKEASLASVVDNEQREDLNEIENARAYANHMTEFNVTQEVAAVEFQVSRQKFAQIVRLLSLPLDVQELLEDGKIEFSHARLLVPLNDPQMQRRWAMEVVKKKLSVVALTAKLKTAVNQKTANVAQPDPNLIYINKIQVELSERLGQKVVLNHNRDHTGVLRVYYNSIEELHGFIEKSPGLVMTLNHSINHSGVVMIEYDTLDELDIVLNTFAVTN